MSTTAALHAYAWPHDNEFEARAGRFYFELRNQRILWTDEIFRIHGYEPGEVVPTLELIHRHKHPDDLAHSRNLLKEAVRSGGHISNYHRILDAGGREHRVITLARSLQDTSGNVHALEGWMADLTGPVRLELQDHAREALANSHVAVIERAKGLVMGHFGLSEDAAVLLMKTCSQSTHTKLHLLAARILHDADKPATRDTVLTELLGGPDY